MKGMMVYCFIIVLAISCKSAKESVSLTGVTWVAESLNGKEIKFKEARSEVFLTFHEAEKKISGKAGCNHFFGIYEKKKSELTFSDMGATKMACQDMDIEASFFKVLEEAKSFAIKNDKLTLKNDGNVIAVFKALEEKTDKKK